MSLELLDRQIAKGLGVSDKTVGTQRKEMEESAEIPQLNKTIGADGKERPRQRKSIKTTYEVPTKKDVIALKHTGDQESYTPQKYIESARRVMGSINLDPASNEVAQKTIKADIFYTNPFDIVIDPFAGGGSTIRISVPQKRMGILRCVDHRNSLNESLQFPDSPR